MFDWFKIELMNHPTKELRKKIDFVRSVNMKTGEVLGTYEIGYFKIHQNSDCVISIRIFQSGRVWIQGSIHKFWNGENHSILTLAEAKKAFDYIMQTLEINSENCKILQLEYGLNMYLDFNPNEILKRIICYKYRPFDGLGNIDKIGKRCSLREYDVKIYNKGKQYNLSDNIIRIEKKIKDAKHLKKFGINTLADLNDLKAENLANDLIILFDEVLIDDLATNEKGMTVRQKLAFAKYRNPNFWNGISRAERLNSKKRFKDILEKFGNENFLEKIKNQMRIELKNLMKPIEEH